MADRKSSSSNDPTSRRRPKVVKVSRPEDTPNKLEIKSKQSKVVSSEAKQSTSPRKKSPKVLIIQRGESEPEESFDSFPSEEEIPVPSPKNKPRQKPDSLPEQSPDVPSIQPKVKPQRKKRNRRFGQKEFESQMVAYQVSHGRRRWMIRLGFLMVGMFAIGLLQSQIAFWMGISTKSNSLQENCLGIQPALNWGASLSELECSRGVFGEGQDLDDLLLSRNIHWKKISELNRLAFLADAPKPTTGDPFTLMFPKADPLNPKLFVFQPDSIRVVLMNLEGEPRVHVHSRKVLKEHIVTKTVRIREDLADVMFNQEYGLILTEAIEKVLRWKVDFFHLSPGDYFTIAYEEKQMEGGQTILGKIRAIHFHTQGKDINAFYFKHEKLEGYYDQFARPMASSFLLSPVRYGRISSYYNLRRRDPILKNGTVKAHLGTDYAAPLGTPILAVADGIVEKAENKGANGNYVKLIHSPEIKTQYLHMQSFAEGIEPGRQVSQGDIIGYVGSTGRSTGPHVCFRYWKNGKQVNHLKEEFPSPEPISGVYSDYFFENRDTMRAYLDGFF